MKNLVLMKITASLAVIMISTHRVSSSTSAASVAEDAFMTTDIQEQMASIDPTTSVMTNLNGSSIDEKADMHSATNTPTEMFYVTEEELPLSTDVALDGGSRNDENALGDVVFDWSWHPMPWTWWRILQLLCALLGIVGNSLVILVVFRRRSRSRSTDLLVGSLAFADFFSSFFLIPYPVISTQPNTALGFWYCTIAETKLFMWLCIYVSTYSLVAISFDRYLAISHPLVFKRIVTRRRTSVCICFVWLLGCALSLWSIFIHEIDSSTGKCVFTWASPMEQVAFGCYNFIARLIVPVMLLLITQILTARALHRDSARVRKLMAHLAHPHMRPSVHRIARDNVIKLMLVVVVVFIICWTPNQLAFFLFNMEIIPRTYFKSPLHRVLIVQAFFNSCLNPIIYTVRHGKFRAALLELLPGHKVTNAPVFEEGIETSGSSKDIRMSSISAPASNA